MGNSWLGGRKIEIANTSDINSVELIECTDIDFQQDDLHHL